MPATFGFHPGPCLFFDLVRSARKGRTTLLRVLYAAALLIALWLAHNSPVMGYWHDRTSFNWMSYYAEQFVHTILMLQIGAVIFLTPAYVAGALAEEKEGGTLYLILTTHLRRGDIVLGKLLSRLLQVAAVLLGSVPVFSLVQLWGGIDVRLVLAVMAITALLLLSIGSVSIAISAMCRTAWGALVLSYVTLFIIFIVLQCGMHNEWVRLLTLRDGAVDIEKALLAHVSLHVSIALIFLPLAIVALRAEPSRLAEQTAVAVKKKRRHLAHVVSLRPNFLLGLPRLRSMPPLLWKETYHGDWLSWVVVFLYLPPLVFFLVPWLITEVSHFNQYDLKHGLFVTLIFWTACAMCLAVGFRAAGSVVRERQRGTLDGLLTLPIDRGDILQAKWWGSLRQGRWLGICLALVCGAALATQAIPFVGGLLFAVVLAVHIVFLTSLGVWLSVICRTRTQANLLLGGIVFGLVVVLPFIGGMSFGYYSPSFLAVLGIVPIETWLHLLGAFDVDYYGMRPPRANAAPFVLSGTLLYALAAWGLWKTAGKSFAAQ